MTLNKEDGQLYYRLWLPLLGYVNNKYKINEDLPFAVDVQGLNPNEVKKVADKLWEDVSLIDEYLSEHGSEMPEEHRVIVESWKRKVKGRFVLERHLKKGSILVSMDDDAVYQVNGITTSWEEMLWYRKPPIMLEAVFIPFKDVIITDGLVIPYNVIIGSNMARKFKEMYMAAKKSGRVYKTL